MSDGKQVENINTRDLSQAAVHVRELRNKIKNFGKQSLTKKEREACNKYGLMGLGKGGLISPVFGIYSETTERESK